MITCSILNYRWISLYPGPNFHSLNQPGSRAGPMILRNKWRVGAAEALILGPPILKAIFKIADPELGTIAVLDRERMMAISNFEMAGFRTS